MNSNLPNDNHSHDVNELLQRIHDLEQQLESQKKGSKTLKILFSVIGIIFGLLFLVGLIQFLSV